MRRVLLAAVVLATLMAGGCGIPDESDVTVVGNGPSSGVAVGDEGVPPVQYTRESTADVEQFVEYYLQAAAGDPDTALARVKAFLSPDEAADFPADTDITVVREVEKPLHTPGDPEVKLTLQEVGTLKSNGVLQPAGPAPEDLTPTLRVGSVAGQSGLFMLDAPPRIMLTDEALASFYQRKTIYFWNKENTSLVPDLRYMPVSVPAVQQPTTILNWLVGGPSPWLADAVQSLPQGTTVPDNVPAENNGTLQISLSAQAIPAGSDSGARDRLRRQLQWSLRQGLPRTLEIKIGHEDPVSYKDAEYEQSNLAYGLADVPERFVVYNGVIRRLKNTPNAEDPVPVLRPEANKNVSWAAFKASGGATFAAVVTGSGGAARLRVGSAPAGQEADLREVGGLPGKLGQPVWALVSGARPNAIGLITVNDRLYSFRSDGTRAQRVDWQGDPGPVTAVSVAPDGRRVAVVSGNKLYRAVLTISGDGLSLSDPEQLLPPSLTGVAAVAWSSETYLAVAGVRSDRRYSVLDVSVDGVLSTTRLADIGATPVTYLTAYPENPVRGAPTSDTESYVADGSAWDVLGDPFEITLGELAGPTPSPQAGITPTAPMFLH